MWVLVIVLAGVAALLWFVGRNVPNGERLMDMSILVMAFAVALLAWFTRS